jgi:hypothetical protein
MLAVIRDWRRIRMALYLISYDIAEKDAFEYEGLWDRLKTLGATKILYSEWVLPREVGTSSEIYDEICGLIQGKDRLLVQEITKDAMWDKLLISDDVFKRLLGNARG